MISLNFRSVLIRTLKRTAGSVTVVIDSTGLKVFGAGEWQQEKHGGKPRQTWRKLHLAVNPDTGDILASELTATDDGDASLVGALLEKVPQEITAQLGWQRAVGYGKRSLVEVAVLRYKALIGRGLRARTLPAQKTEAAAGCRVLNVMTGLGRPVSRRVA